MVRVPAVEVPVPVAVRDATVLDRVDHQDAFQVDAATPATPEEWMRAVIEGAPRWFQLPWLHVLGRGVLRARIGPLHAPGYVLGWRILLDRPDVFAVGLDGAGGVRVRLAVVAPPGRAVFATRIRFGTPLVRACWPVIRPAHRFFAPFLLDRARARIADAGRPVSPR